MRVLDLHLEHRGKEIKVIAQDGSWEIRGNLVGMRVETEAIPIRDLANFHDEYIPGHTSVYLDVWPWSSGALHPDTYCELL
jgi:hypothetical protein